MRDSAVDQKLKRIPCVECDDERSWQKFASQKNKNLYSLLNNTLL